MTRLSRPAATAKGTYLEIAAELQEDILVGRLVAGQRLPTQRDYARMRQVTQGTIHRAYAELARRGLISAEVGRGSFVLDVRRTVAQGPYAGLIDMAANKPATSAHVDALRQAMQRLQQRKNLSELLEYQPAVGAWRHREAAARWLSSFSINTCAENVALTVGAQQGNAAALLALTEPGASVLVEEFTYTGMKSLAYALDRQLVPVAMDEKGILPDALRETALRSGAKCLYCMPGLHNPTNATMPESRRQILARLAEELDLQIIEDGVYDFMVEPGTPPLAALIPHRTVYVTSLSKSVASGLRLGVVAAPEQTLHAISTKIQNLVWTAPPLIAQIACDWMDEGMVAELTKKHLAECLHRLSIARHVLAGVRFEARPHTAHLWMRLPSGWESTEFVAAAKRNGVVLAPTSAFAVGEAASQSFVRIGLASPESSQLVASGLTRIAEVLNHSAAARLPHKAIT